jgi:hypothetical protein
MARPVRPGTGTTHRTSEASQPGMQTGTLFADPIRASSPKSTASTGRTEDCSRPTPIRQISLAMREPSTEDVRSSAVGSCSDVCCEWKAAVWPTSTSRASCSLQFIEQRPRLLKLGRVEALDKAVEDRTEKRFAALALITIALQSAQRHRGT